jgi:hypothetical protein
MCGYNICSHYDCNFRNGSGYCGITACIHPEYSAEYYENITNATRPKSTTYIYDNMTKTDQLFCNSGHKYNSNTDFIYCPYCGKKLR